MSEPAKRSRLGAKTGLAMLAATTIGGFEGVRQAAYPDPATRGHPWTICYGETEGVKKGDWRSMQECKIGLAKGLERYALGMEKCLKVNVTDGQYIAALSLTWNIGVGGFCKSSIASNFNAGRPQAACDALLKYNRAAGVVFPGLTRRRVAERQLCLQG